MYLLVNILLHLFSFNLSWFYLRNFLHYRIPAGGILYLSDERT